MKRISNRATTLRRQTWLDLPASGIEEVASKIIIVTMTKKSQLLGGAISFKLT